MRVGVVHVAGPDFEYASNTSLLEAAERLAGAHHQVFLAVATLHARDTLGPNVRLLPVSSGMFAGTVRQHIALLGVLAI
eukprot:6263669-Alexandrium_andersonii.AAC.1